MPAPMMTTRASPGRSSRDGMLDRFLADGNEALQLLVNARVNAGVLVVGQQLLPLLVGHLVGSAGAHPIPAVVILSGGDHRAVVAIPEVAVGVVGRQAMSDTLW